MNLNIGWVDSGKFNARYLRAFYPRKESTESCDHLSKNLYWKPRIFFWQMAAQITNILHSEPGEDTALSCSLLPMGTRSDSGGSHGNRNETIGREATSFGLHGINIFSFTNGGQRIFHLQALAITIHNEENLNMNDWVGVSRGYCLGLIVSYSLKLGKCSNGQANIWQINRAGADHSTGCKFGSIRLVLCWDIYKGHSSQWQTCN